MFTFPRQYLRVFTPESPFLFSKYRKILVKKYRNRVICTKADQRKQRLELFPLRVCYLCRCIFNWISFLYKRKKTNREIKLPPGRKSRIFFSFFSLFFFFFLFLVRGASNACNNLTLMGRTKQGHRPIQQWPHPSWVDIHSFVCYFVLLFFLLCIFLLLCL